MRPAITRLLLPLYFVIRFGYQHTLALPHKACKSNHKQSPVTSAVTALTCQKLETDGANCTYMTSVIDHLNMQLNGG